MELLTLREAISSQDPVAAFAEVWERIENEVDFEPIFRVARASQPIEWFARSTSTVSTLGSGATPVVA